MTLSRCDVCKKEMSIGEMGKIDYQSGYGKGRVYYDMGKEFGFDTIPSASMDICNECAVKVLKILFPNRIFSIQGDEK